MSYNDRIDAALTAIKEHNDAIGGQDKPGYLNPDDFIACVKASGGTSEDRLSALSHEDLLACMPDEKIKPRVLAKEIAVIFRKKDEISEDKQPISNKRADRMTVLELVKCFDPEDSTNAVANRLASISKNEKFIVYSSGRNVDTEVTFKILNEIKSGFSGRDDIDVNGVVKKVYRIGELPENFADENPLYYNRPLRPDGTCDQTGRSWEGIDLSIRQLVRLAMETGELKVVLETAHNVLDMVLEQDAFKKLRQRYRKASLKFDESSATGNLPKLKIILGNKESANLFRAGKKVSWYKVDEQ